MKQMPNLVGDEQESQPTFEQHKAPSTQELYRSSRMHQIFEKHGFIIEDDEPTSYEEAMCDIDSKRWLEAIKSEMDSMYDNQVWTLVDPPKGIKFTGCKWIFKKKTDIKGNMIIYKAMLVVKGYKQRQGVDFDETFSPIAMLKSIRILLMIVAYYDYEIW